MSFPLSPHDTTSGAPSEPSPPDFAPYTPYAPYAAVAQATDTPTPRWSIWALVGAIWGIVAVVGAGAANVSITVAGALCVAGGSALVCGLLGLVAISESHGRLKGRGFALVGVVLGVAGIIMLTHLASSQLAAHFEQYPPFAFPSDD